MIDTWVDTDFAGCLTTRKSASGGMAIRGGHLIKHWSSTQKTIDLSSGDAELAGVAKGGGEGLGIQRLALGSGISLGSQVHVDSRTPSAYAIGQALAMLVTLRSVILGSKRGPSWCHVGVHLASDGHFQTS